MIMMLGCLAAQISDPFHHYYYYYLKNHHSVHEQDHLGFLRLSRSVHSSVWISFRVNAKDFVFYFYL